MVCYSAESVIKKDTMLVITVLLLTFLSTKADSTTQKLNISAPTQKQSAVTQEKAFSNTSSAFDTTKNSSISTDAPTTEVTTTELSISTTIGSCENNDTECDNNNVTTVTPVNNDTDANKTSKDENKKSPRSKIDEDANICTCNLQAYVCDINCCCDPDCSQSDKTVFGRCDFDENRYYDTRYCDYIKYIYVNNTPFKWNVNQDGFFCIISSNVPETYLIQNEDPISSLENIKVQKKFWYEEKDNFLESKFQFGSKKYGFGDSIMIVRDDSSIDNFRLPKNFLTSSCIFEEDVYYLKDVENSCSQTTIEDDNAKLNFSSFFKRFKIIGSPQLINSTKLNNNIYKNCPKNICFDVEAKLCNINFTNCSDIKNTTTTNSAFHCSYDFKKNLNTCQNAVEKIHYRFYHNGSTGLLKVEVFGVLKNFSYHFGGKSLELFQDLSVEFLWIDQVKNASRMFSGNPGYISGKPILAGLKITNETTAFIKRDSPQVLQNFLVFPANVEGACTRNETYHTPIDFEYNMIAKCKLQRKLSFGNSQIATGICRSIQEHIFDLWGVNRELNTSLVVGLFGNANASNFQEWTSVLYRVSPKDFLNATLGYFSDKNKTLVCRNMSQLVNVDVFYSRIDLKTVLNQHKVLGVSFSFGNVRNYSFSLSKRNNDSSSLDLSLEIVSKVSFYDVTGDKTQKFVEPPLLDIRLPYDFFYPFIRIGNGVSLAMPNTVVNVLFLYLSFLL